MTARTLTSKLPQTGSSIFSVMSALAEQHNAINLAQGFPNFPPPAELIRKVAHYMETGFNQYAPMPGVLRLREAIARKTLELYSYQPDPATEITVISGATEGLYAAITAVVQAGDEVILLEPCYDSYAPAVVLNGGKPVPVALVEPNFQIDWDKVRKSITSRTKLLIFNNPHNPSGAVYGKEDLEELEKLVAETGIYVISDEVYEHMVFDGEVHQSALSFPALRERSFVLSSFGKTYHATGWKAGYCIAPAALTTEFRKIHQFLVFSTHTPTQYALADYLEEKQHYLELPEFYQKKRDLFCQLLGETGFRFTPAAGSYFQLADYSTLSNEPDQEFAKRLTKEIGVAAIPVSAFYHNQHDTKLLRFCFAKDEDTLVEAASRLRTL